MSNQLPIVIGSHAAESGKKRVAAYCRVHRHRAFGVFTRRVRDRSMLPPPADAPGGHAGHGKRGAAWS